ncbi:MAG: hypothetical protein KC776_13110 [Myxococcales bacterium]|nr:hypothetical protein [Myxococcales bacterium]MCB9583514.1 hypothetical protein [Polyangiaceae bacterium]
MRRARFVTLGALAAIGGAVAVGLCSRAPERVNARLGRFRGPAPLDPAAQCSVRPLSMPTGGPAVLGCRDARRVVSEVRARLAAPAGEPIPNAFASATTGWLDPHGLWSAAPDAPAKALIRRHAAELIAEIEKSPRDGSDCTVAREIGRATQLWVNDLRKIYESATSDSPKRAYPLATAAVFEDDPVQRPARQLARDLGARGKSFRAAYGDAEHAASKAEARLFPELSVEQWAGAVLAAAVRAYVPAVDAHGQWAPLDEEWSLYAADSALDVGPRLWGRMMRTALGIVVLEDPTPPLEQGDLVLSIGGIATAGLSVEQAEQLSRLEPAGGETVRDVVVLRKGEKLPRRFRVSLDDEAPAEPLGDDFEVTRVSYGDGEVAVIAMPDVPDGLGEDLGRTVSELRSESPTPLAILLDLRGNGGGSIDGAAGAIGVFIPGAPMFPLRRRGGAVEVQRSPAPSGAMRWPGPVATLVDGYTASAAEMIAGALASYRRGEMIGARTFGKGCVQEYFDDRSGVGVLRLTTMLFAMPDGSPLQGVGLLPDLSLGLPTPREREKTLTATFPAWRGPDIRVAGALGGPEFPAHHGHVGGCTDAVVCSALRHLGAAPPRRSAARGHSPKRGAR